MNSPKILNAPDSIWLCYGTLSKMKYTNRTAHNITWCEMAQDYADVKYIRADIVDKLREELDITQRALQLANLGAAKAFRDLQKANQSMV